MQQQKDVSHVAAASHFAFAKLENGMAKWRMLLDWTENWKTERFELYPFFVSLAPPFPWMLQTFQKWSVQHFMQAADTDDHNTVAWEHRIICVWHRDAISIFCAMANERMNHPTSPPNRPFNATKAYATTYWRAHLLAYKTTIDAGKGK